MTRYPKTGKKSKWTIKELDAVKPDWQGDILADSEGLNGEVRVSKSGEVSIHFKYDFKWRGQKARYYCGAYPTNELVSIRHDRDDARKLVSQGIDPRTHKVASKIEAQAIVEAVIETEQLKQSENLTVNDLFNTWVKDGVARLDGNKAIKYQFNKHVLPSIGGITLRDLTEKNLLDLYRSLVGEGKIRTSDATAKNIKQMFKWAEDRQPWRRLLIEGNPAKLVKMEVVLPADWDGIRDRVLSDKEINTLGKIFVKMQKDYDKVENKYSLPRPIQKTTELALWICLSTICRIGELLKSEWQHINFDKRIWFIPAKNTKGRRRSKKNHYVYLSDFALNIFKQLHDLTGETKWLFPATNKAEGHVYEKSVSKQIGDRQSKFKKKTKALKNRVNNNDLVIGSLDWTPHDLRRTGSTIMQRLKIDTTVINKCQNHSVFGSAEKINLHYLHYQHKIEMVDAWEKLGFELEKIVAEA